MSSLFSYILYLQVWFIYNEINHCSGTAGLTDGTFSLGFNVDFSSDVAMTQAASISSGIETNIQAGGGGIGDVAVAGELPLIGTTLVVESMAFLGGASFDAELSAAESVFNNVESDLEGVAGAELIFIFGD